MNSTLKPFRIVAAASALVALAALVAPVQAADYYIGDDSACGYDRMAVAVFQAAFDQDANPRFFISKSKPDEVATIPLNWNNLATVEVRGGYNNCQDAIDGVAPSGKSSVHSNALSTSANRRVMSVGGSNSAPVVTLYDVFISGGRLDNNTIPAAYGAGVFIDQGTLSLVRTTVEGNWSNPSNANSRGGGVTLAGSGRILNIGPGSVVRDNDARVGGGIFCTNSAAVLMEGGDIRDNRARVSGGGLYVANGCIAGLATDGSGGRVHNNSTTHSSEVVNGGAGIRVAADGLVSIAGSSGSPFQITSNTANELGFGGGILLSGFNARLVLNRVHVDNNVSAGGSGGGIACREVGTTTDGVTANNIRIRNNSAIYGGGIYALNCKVDTAGDSEISGNQVVFDGGGIYAFANGADMTVTLNGGSSPVRLSGNQAGRDGGGAMAFSGIGGQATIKLNNSLVTNNQAEGWGGGLNAVGQGAEIIMSRTLAGAACHHEIFCSDLSFNAISGPDTLLGAGAAARDNARLLIEGTYIEANEGTGVRGSNVSRGSGGSIRIRSSVLIPHGNNRLVRLSSAGADLIHNTFSYGSANSRPIAITDGTSGSDRNAWILGNVFDGDLAPVDVPNIDWVKVGVEGGCSSFLNAHIGDPFYSLHAASRRPVGALPLDPVTRLITDPTSNAIDFCDQIAEGLVAYPSIDILGFSRPHETSNPNTHGPWDLGAHEVRTAVMHNLNVFIVGNGSVTIQPGSIVCTANCTHTFEEGTTVTLTASPDVGHVFAGWTSGMCSGTGTCELAMTANRSVAAEFIPAPEENEIFSDRFEQ